MDSDQRTAWGMACLTWITLACGWAIGGGLGLWFAWHGENLLAAVWALFSVVSLLGVFLGAVLAVIEGNLIRK